MANKINGFLKKSGSVLTLIVLGASIVAGFATNRKEIKDNTKDIKDHEDRIRLIETAVTEQRKDVQHIKKTLDRIEKKISIGPSGFINPDDYEIDEDGWRRSPGDYGCWKPDPDNPGIIWGCGVYHGPPIEDSMLNIESKLDIDE
jgi:hypothetical protein